MRVIGLVWVIASGAGLATATFTVPSESAVSKVSNGVIAYSLEVQEGQSSIMTINPDGTENRPLLGADDTFEGGASEPRWSRNGKKLLFARYRSRDHRLVRALWYSSASGKQIKRISLGLGRVVLSGYDWAPDGRRLVFAASPRLSQKPTMYTISIDGTRRKALCRGWWPSWSNDGRNIVFTSLVYRGVDPDRDTDEIAVISPQGTGFRQLTRSGHDSLPSFSPDGKKVVFVRSYRTRDEWRRVEVTGRNDVLIAAHELISPPRFRYCPPQWTPDGKRFAAVRVETGPNDAYTAALITLRPTGRDERVAFKFPLPYVGCDFAWQPKP